MNLAAEDVIAAIATPPGEGGISIIRISGSSAIELGAECFLSRRPLTQHPSHTIHHGHVVSPEGEIIDEALASIFKAPRSFTGENCVEFSCHGGSFIAQRVLAAVVARGARLATPGEFSKRAFLNGKIDLSQAEAIGDLIAARSERAHRISIEQLQGKLSLKVHQLRQQLVQTCSLLELELDFSEEGLELETKSNIINNLDLLLAEIRQLIKSYEGGHLVREGIKVVLAGRPNSGKSSLMNYLLDNKRSIVTSVPGTTRDLLEESMTINGYLVRLVDTAGLRETEDIVEIEGIRRTETSISNADTVLYLFDLKVGYSDIDARNVSRIKTLLSPYAKFYRVGNKLDLVQNEIDPGDYGDIRISAIDGHGIGELKTLVLESISRTIDSDEGVVVTNVRHRNSLVSALENLVNAQTSLDEHKSNEFIALDLRIAGDKLGEIIGEVRSEDILNNIFSHFCIGK